MPGLVNSLTKPSRKPAILARGLVASGSFWVRAATSPASTARCETPTVAISGSVKMVAATWPSRIGCTDSPSVCHIAIRPCMAATEASMSTPVQSPAAYTPGTEVRETRSTSMKPCSSTFTPAASRPQPSVRGTMPTVIRQWLPVTVRPSFRVTVTLSRSRRHRLGPGPAEHGHAAAAEHVLDQVGRVLVLLRQHPVPGGHQRDPRAERLIGAGELGPGDARADHDQVPGQFGQVVELPPGQDALAVGFGAGEHAGHRAGGDQDRVGPDLLVTGHDPTRAVQAAVSGDHPDVLGRDRER